MKNILIIPPFNPYPLVSGGHQAIFNGIAILKDVANVYVCVPTTESMHKKGKDRDLERALPFVKVLYYIEPSSRHTFKWYWKTLFNKLKCFIPVLKKRKISNVSEQTSQCALEDIYDIPDTKKQFILNAIKRYNIEIVQVEMIRDIKIVEYLPPQVKTIFVQHEIKFVKDGLYLNEMGNVPKDVRNRYEENRIEEIRLHNLYNHIITLSSIDTQKLQEGGVSVPIATSLAIVKPQIDSAQGKQEVLKVLSYVGPEGHYPNYDGVMWFLENCWSLLMDKDPEYTIQIIGNWSEQTALELAEKYDNRVKCVGFVDDLGESLAGTTMIVPLNIGSGIRMKILEAAQLNVPVVTTPVGGEGLPLVDGENCFIASEPNIFVEDILKLQDVELRQKFVKQLQKIIATKYSLQALKESRILLYK